MLGENGRESETNTHPENWKEKGNEIERHSALQRTCYWPNRRLVLVTYLYIAAQKANDHCGWVVVVYASVAAPVR